MRKEAASLLRSVSDPFVGMRFNGNSILDGFDLCCPSLSWTTCAISRNWRWRRASIEWTETWRNEIMTEFHQYCTEIKDTGNDDMMNMKGEMVKVRAEWWCMS